MPERHLDVRALIAALDAQRQAKNLSWREVARESGVAASTLTRMHQGKRPDVDTFGALLAWLKMPAERFFAHGEAAHTGASPPAKIAAALGGMTLLRGKKKLSPKATEALQDIVNAAFKLFKERQ